jgi:hypothetical protein
MGFRGYWTRAALKKDLEMLKHFEPTDPNHAIIKAHIARLVQTMYAPPVPLHYHLPSVETIHGIGAKIKSKIKSLFPQVKDPFALWIGSVIFFVFTLATAGLNQYGFSWWSLVTIPLAVFGFSGIIVAFQEPKERAVDGPHDA